MVMCIRKKKLTVLILAEAVLLLGLPLAACGSAALPSASSPASQSLPPEPAKEPKQSTSNGVPSDPSVEEPEQSSLPAPAENAPESSSKAFPSVLEEEQEGASGESIQEVTEMKLKVEVGEQTFSATLEENTAVNALVELLRQGPITLRLHDDSGWWMYNVSAKRFKEEKKSDTKGKLQ
jgi:hypothetical protein